MIPVILSSDKTQTTVFRGKTAYPVYLTIGNIPKDIRRKSSCHAQILIAYLPTSKLEGISNKAARRRALANIFHACMRSILAPIVSYGETGVRMMSGDGAWRRCHPIFAIFVGDYPEQTLVTCTYNGRCPKCSVPLDQLGDYASFPPHDLNNAIDTFQLAHGDTHLFHAACREAGIKPIYMPFWESLPLANVYVSITPDILHQLLQGVMKHLISWLTSAGAFGRSQIDMRCRILPPNHNITLFPKGISSLSRVSGKEHKAICRLLLGLIVDLPLPDGHLPSRVLRAVRSLLDFWYLAEYPSHTGDTLYHLEEALRRFHTNKGVFIDLGIREAFNIPKLHSLTHYRSSIMHFGTTDNYNTEQSERLHIDFAKDAYRATNHRDEYPQMTAWLERREKVQQHAALIERQLQPATAHGERSAQSPSPIGPLQRRNRIIKMTQNPTARAVSFNILAEKYGAVEFQDTLADYIAQVNHAGASAAAVRARAADTLIPFRSVPVFHKIKFTVNEFEIVDAVHVRPEQVDTRGRTIPPRFDTVLVRSQTQRGTHREWVLLHILNQY